MKSKIHETDHILSSLFSNPRENRKVMRDLVAKMRKTPQERVSLARRFVQDRWLQNDQVSSCFSDAVITDAKNIEWKKVFNFFQKNIA